MADLDQSIRTTSDSNLDLDAMARDYQKVKECISKWYDISDESLRLIKQHIIKELELGLRDEENATIKMLITYVRELSRGDETGSYLALDLGGTHFRVLLVSMSGDGEEPKVTSVTHDIPDDLLTTQNGQQLFDYIALKLLEFVQQYKLKRRRISLGFTFSFPCKQYGLTQSYLVKWCKGFNVGGIVGTDVVRQLKDALKRQLAGLVEAYIDVVAVINDTTGTLVACANNNRECRIGLIVGTGFNACYMERLDRCEKWPANYTSPKQVIINCEWGAMGDNRDRRELDKFRNEFDAQVDQESVNPRSQTYEKMVSGLYVGELLRLSLLKLHQGRLLFQGAVDSAPTVNSGAQLQQQHHHQQQQRDSNNNKQAYKLVSANKTDSNQCARGSSLSAIKSAAQSSLDTSSHSSTLASGAESHKLNIKNILNGRHLSMLAKDELGGTHDEAIKMMKELNINNYTVNDLEIVIQLGAAIMRRSAHLVASGISALLERLQRPFTVIGYDGSVIKHHPYFLRQLADKTVALTPNELKFEFVQSSDGSGIGAAVVAAALHKERRPLYVVKPGKLYELHFSATHQPLPASDNPAPARTSPVNPGVSKSDQSKK